METTGLPEFQEENGCERRFVNYLPDKNGWTRTIENLFPQAPFIRAPTLQGYPSMAAWEEFQDLQLEYQKQGKPETANRIFKLVRDYADKELRWLPYSDSNRPWKT